MLKSFISGIVAKHMSKKLNSLTIKEEDITELLRQIRITLLNADVNLLVVKDLIKNIRAKSVGQVIPEKSNPQQFMLTTIKEEIQNILGGNQSPMNYEANPCKILLVGLQGSGKTTTAGKLATLAKTKLSRNPLLVALDIYRPAAIDQLHTLAGQSEAKFYEGGLNKEPYQIATDGLEYAKQQKCDFIVFDTAGRLQTNEKLMDELVSIKKAVHPDEILMVVDAMAGQDMINVAKEFNDRLNLTGFIISKLDSDARGGVALSLTHILNVPIKLIGTGERLGSLDNFYPERMADRIMGLGDVMTLAEKAADVVDEKAVKKSLSRMLAGKMTFEDLLVQTKQMQKIGSIGSIAKMIPQAEKYLSSDSIDQAEQKILVWTILMNSMTAKERANPTLFKKQPTRRERVIRGSGRTPEEFNRLYTTWEKFKKQMEEVGNQLRKGKNPFARFMQ